MIEFLRHHRILQYSLSYIILGLLLTVTVPAFTAGAESVGGGTGISEPKLQIESGTGPLGTIVPLRLWVLNPGNVAAGSFKLSYNPSLVEPVFFNSKLKIDPGDLGSIIESNQSSTGQISVAVLGTATVSAQEAVLCTIYFNLLQEGLSPMELSAAELSSGSSLIQAASINGSLEIIPPTNGITITAAASKDTYANSTDTRQISITLDGTVTADTLPANSIKLMILDSSAKLIGSSDPVTLNPDGKFTFLWAVPVNLSEGTYTLQALYNEETYNQLDTFSIVRIDKPQAQPEPGEFTTSLDVALNCPTAGAEIYYTDNGTEPSINSKKYTTGTPIHLQADATIMAVAIKSGASSEVVSFTYSKADEPPIEGCFIATAAYGSKFAPAVVLLRNFRDSLLLSNKPGQAFVAFYYHNSPPIAAFIADSEPLKILARGLLTPLVGVAYLMLHPGLLPLSLCIMLFMWRFIRKRRLGGDKCI